jgi:hypothetical protein
MINPQRFTHKYHRKVMFNSKRREQIMSYTYNNKNHSVIKFSNILDSDSVYYKISVGKQNISNTLIATTSLKLIFNV